MGLNEPVSGEDDAADITLALQAARDGDPQASAKLLPLVYQQLRRLAASHMRNENAGQTLQATALVHEAYLRLVDQTKVQRWDTRWHFFAAAAEAMRRILVDHARQKRSLKRGGDQQRMSLDAIELSVGDPPDEFLALDEALTALAQEHPHEAQLVKLRYFAGLTIEEAAAAMGVSARTVKRNWAYARAWLFSRMTSSGTVL